MKPRSRCYCQIVSCSRFAPILAICFGLSCQAFAENWPAWRGPQGTGISAEKHLPEHWTTNENVRWHISLPGPGNSSPITWGGKIFLTQFIKSENRRSLMCFDRTDGKLLWQSGVTYTEQEPTQESNPYCSATPVTDGERVIASFGSAGLYCFDFDGKEVWHREFGKMNHMFGNAASPVIHGDLCFLNFGPDEKARLIAVNKRDGKTIWEAEPPKVDPSEQQPMRGGFGGRGGPGGPGGPGGGGFGPGMFIAPQIVSQADKNADNKITRDEFLGLADAWFDKLDKDKAGNVSQEQFEDRFSELLPPLDGMRPPPGQGPDQDSRPGRDRGGFGPGRFIAPALFNSADADKDGKVTRPELKTVFGKWFADWDAGKTGFINEEQIRDGFNAALPRPNFGGPGGPGGRGPGGPGGRGGGGPGGSWSSPIIVQASGHDELIMNFPNRLVAYQPDTGHQLWLSKGLGGTIYTTPLYGEATLVAMSSDMGGAKAIAVKPGATGELNDNQRLWRIERMKSAIGSGVIYQGHLYSISSDGIASCYDLKDGSTLWEERLKGSGSKTGSWSSVILANGKIYVPNQSGDVFVLRADPRFEVLATNSIFESTNASLAASDDDLFLRSNKSLWCLALKKD